MDAPDSNGSFRGLAERVVAALTESLGLRDEEGRGLAEDLSARWRGESIRLTERASVTLSGIFRELGLVTKSEVEELELRVSQLEHRLRLLEAESEARPQL